MAALFLLFILSAIIPSVHLSGYIKDQIVVKLPVTQANCVRFLNGTTSVGCQSSQNGNTGVLVPIKRPDDIENELKNLPLGMNNLIALVEANDLDRNLLQSLRTNAEVKGIVLYYEKNGVRPRNFSEDAACPNQQFSFYKNHANSICEWNAGPALHPEGLKFLAFDKPIRFVENSTEVDLLLNKCAYAFNNRSIDGFRCVGRMTTFMPAAGSAPLCMSRQEAGQGFSGHNPLLCEPLSDRNVFAMLPPLNQQNKTKADQFVLAARMDTFSTNFDAPSGDISVLTSIISLLSVANAIGNNKAAFLRNAKNKQLLFAFFHGESLGYIGSSRWLWEMQEGRFPNPPSKFSQPVDNVRQIRVDDLSFYLELQQIGIGDRLYLHTDKEIYDAHKELIDEISQAAQRQSTAVHFVEPNKNGSLPPSSYHSILKESRNVSGMILATFDAGESEFRYLNSLFDTEIRNNSEKFDGLVDKLHEAAQVALKSALKYVFNGSSQKEFSVDREYTKELAECFFKHPDWDCQLFLDITNASSDPIKRAWLRRTANHLYIGTDQHFESSIRKIVFSLLVDSLGYMAVGVASAQQCREQNKKQNVYTYVWQNDRKLNRSICYRTSIYLGMAKSPAFEIKDYDFTSGKYSTWMESTQTGGTMELYLKADYRLELSAFLAAFVMLLASAPLYFMFKEQWFIDNTLPPASPQPL